MSIIAFQYIPVMELNVDRWSVITSFWDAYFDGNYVFLAESHSGNHPGPMPFYFLIALPFYLTGELGLLSLMGLILVWLMLHCGGLTIEDKASAVILIATSCFFLWEVTTRSNIIVNATLILLALIYLSKGISKPGFKQIMIHGLIIGLLLSTRMVVIIPFIIFYIYCLKSGKVTFLNIVYTGLIATLAFFITYLPFVIGHWDQFLSMNPLIIQSSYFLPTYLNVLFVTGSIPIAFLCVNRYDVIYYSGNYMFLLFFTYLIYWTVQLNFQESFFQSKTDISYFLFCVPFLLYAMYKKPE